jgi:small subunit ribosomal protein S6e
MVFKTNISHKGKALKIEVESEELIGKKIGEILDGKEISKDLDGYELEITGTSDIAGFPGKKDVEGANLKRVLLKKGFGMKTKPKGLKKKPYKMPEGYRLKKTVRGNTISKETIQINLKVKKEGGKKFEEMLPKKEKAEEKPAEQPQAA